MAVSYPASAQTDSRPAPAVWRDAVHTVLLETCPAATAVLDRELRYLSTNRRWIEEFELDAGSVIGRTHDEVFPDLHDDWRRLYQWCLLGHSQRCEDDLRIRSDGAADWVRWEIHPWHEPAGAVGGLILTCSVIQESRHSPTGGPAAVQAEETPDSLFAAFSGTFQEITEAAPFGLILLNDDAEVLYANPQHRSILGFSVEESGGLDPWLVRGCHGAGEPLQQAATAEWWERVWRRHSACTLSMRNADGLIKEIEFRPAPLPGHRLLLTVLDVTDASVERQNLRQAEARYRSLFQQSSSAMILLNPAGQVLEVNAVCETLTGCSRFEMRSAGLAEFFPPEVLDRVRQATAGFILDTPPPPPDQPAELLSTRLRTAGGHTLPVSFSITVVQNSTGVSPLLVCSLQPAAPGGREIPAALSPDLSLTLDHCGAVLGYCAGRDFESYPPGHPEPAGALFEMVFPAFSPLPLDAMRSHLLEAQESEVRCEFTSVLPPSEKIRSFEARMICLPPAARAWPSAEETETLPVFGLTIRDVTAVASRMETETAPRAL